MKLKASEIGIGHRLTNNFVVYKREVCLSQFGQEFICFQDRNGREMILPSDKTLSICSKTTKPSKRMI